MAPIQVKRESDLNTAYRLPPLETGKAARPRTTSSRSGSYSSQAGFSAARTTSSCARSQKGSRSDPGLQGTSRTQFIDAVGPSPKENEATNNSYMPGSGSEILHQQQAQNLSTRQFSDSAVLLEFTPPEHVKVDSQGRLNWVGAGKDTTFAGRGQLSKHASVSTERLWQRINPGCIVPTKAVTSTSRSTYITHALDDPREDDLRFHFRKHEESVFAELFCLQNMRLYGNPYGPARH
mmetsp:Transcript_18909/g.31022  ORF Transcript_18909/g.31022 Transcript_18909/m.31022 type:complete len:236 (+) Transcript_18909:113-820(+)